MSYQSFLEKGSTVFLPFPFLPFERRLFLLGSDDKELDLIYNTRHHNLGFYGKTWIAHPTAMFFDARVARVQDDFSFFAVRVSGTAKQGMLNMFPFSDLYHCGHIPRLIHTDCEAALMICED
jgi:hypothetical protein